MPRIRLSCGFALGDALLVQLKFGRQTSVVNNRDESICQYWSRA